MIELLNVVAPSEEVRILPATDFSEEDANNCEKKVDLELRTTGMGRAEECENRSWAVAGRVDCWMGVGL